MRSHQQHNWSACPAIMKVKLKCSMSEKNKTLDAKLATRAGLLKQLLFEFIVISQVE